MYVAYIASLRQDVHRSAGHEAALPPPASDPRHEVGVEEEEVGPREGPGAVHLPVQEALHQSLRELSVDHPQFIEVMINGEIVNRIHFSFHCSIFLHICINLSFWYCCSEIM